MPRMRGDEALIHLRKQHPVVPVVMLTALTDLEIFVDTVKKGPFDHLVNPIRKARLVDRTEEPILANKRLKNTNLKTVKILAETIEAKDPYTRGHCNRVRMLAARIARCAGLSRDMIEMLEYGALLHDIGKIGIPENLLNKIGRLEDGEIRNFQLHTVIGESILRTVDFFHPCLRIIRSHHEWFNGAGYPDGIRGNGIDLTARIVSISDAFDAMTSTRPYRTAMPVEVALAELRNGREVQFDPSLVDVFIEHGLYASLGAASGDSGRQ
jgi:putative two-component system response regulator